MECKEVAKFLFFGLAILSGIFWNLCKEESAHDSKVMYSPFWFIERDKFTEKGNRYRKIFIVVSSLAMIDIFIWAAL